MKNRLLLYIGAMTTSSIILGNLVRSWVFFAGAISFISIFVVATRGLPPDELDLEISRKNTEKELYVGDDLEITVEIENNGDEVRFLEVYDILPSQLIVAEKSNHQIIKIEENETKEMRYRVSCPVTGKFEIGPIRLRFRDSLNFFSKTWKNNKKMDLRVLPMIEEMDSVDIKPSYTKHWMGQIKSRSIGMGSEFFSLREYRPGDEMKDINWKATARHLSPMTNEFEGEKAGDVILVVDGYEDSVVGDLETNTLKSSIRAAGSLASQLLSDRNRVGLIIMGDYLNWVYPSTGKMQFYRIMENLTRFEKGGMWELKEIKWLLKDFFPRKSYIIFISPLNVPEFSETIVDLCLKDYDVTVISPDPLKIEKETVDDYDEKAQKICEEERKATIERLWDYGTVVDWDPTEPLEPKLEEVLKYQQKAQNR